MSTSLITESKLTHDILLWPLASATEVPASTARQVLGLHTMINHTACQTPPSIFAIERNRPPPIVTESRKSSYLASAKTMYFRLFSSKIHWNSVSQPSPGWTSDSPPEMSVWWATELVLLSAYPASFFLFDFRSPGPHTTVFKKFPF